MGQKVTKCQTDGWPLVSHVTLSNNVRGPHGAMAAGLRVAHFPSTFFILPALSKAFPMEPWQQRSDLFWCGNADRSMEEQKRALNALNRRLASEVGPSQQESGYCLVG